MPKKESLKIIESKRYVPQPQWQRNKIPCCLLVSRYLPRSFTIQIGLSKDARKQCFGVSLQLQKPKDALSLSV
eukprot:scaffold25088_cov72-Skeletonema_dohrnii-CCMP3373.AAC.3